MKTNNEGKTLPPKVCYLSTFTDEAAVNDTKSGVEHLITATMGLNIGGKIAIPKIAGSRIPTV